MSQAMVVQTLVFRFGKLACTLMQLEAGLAPQAERRRLDGSGSGLVLLRKLDDAGAFEIEALHPSFEVALYAVAGEHDEPKFLRLQRFHGEPTTALRWASAFDAELRQPSSWVSGGVEP